MEMATLTQEDLRAQYSDISDDLYEIIYNAAYDRGHSYGLEEVACFLPIYYDMAKKILEIGG